MTLMTTAPETAATLPDVTTIEPLRELTRQLLQHAPAIALFVAVLVVGFIVAAVLRRVTVWLVDKSGLEALSEQAGAAKLLYAIGIKKGVAQVLGTVVWIAVVLGTVAAASEVLGLSAVTSAVGGVVAFLPRLVTGAGVLIGGAALASVLRGLVRRVTQKEDEVDSPAALASIVYYVILTASVLLAADQAGLETALADDLVTVGVAVALAGVALAFALGSKDAFRNLVAGHYLRRLIHTGDEVEIEGKRGVIVRFSPVAVVLRTERGETIVPTRSLLDGPIEVVSVAPPAQPPAGPAT